MFPTMSEKPQLIECPDCESKVSAKVIATREYGPSDAGDPYKVLFLECPACHRTMIGAADLMQISEEDWAYDEPARLWPETKDRLDVSIPALVQKSIREARACYRAKAFSACAVMCGRALEAICKAHKTKDWQLARG